MSGWSNFRRSKSVLVTAGYRFVKIYGGGGGGGGVITGKRACLSGYWLMVRQDGLSGYWLMVRQDGLFKWLLAYGPARWPV